MSLSKGKATKPENLHITSRVPGRERKISPVLDTIAYALCGGGGPHTHACAQRFGGNGQGWGEEEGRRGGAHGSSVDTVPWIALYG